MTRVLVASILTAFVGIAAAPAPLAGQREAVDRRSFAIALSRLSVGDRVTVRERSGVLWRGEFQSVEPMPPRLILANVVVQPAVPGATRQQVLELDESAIEYVALEESRFRARGVLIGLGVGVGAAGIAAQGCCGNPDYGPTTAFLVLAPVFGGAGALVGYLVDKGPIETELVYTASPPRTSIEWRVAPAVTRRSIGAILSLSF